MDRQGVFTVVKTGPENFYVKEAVKTIKRLLATTEESMFIELTLAEGVPVLIRRSVIKAVLFSDELSRELNRERTKQMLKYEEEAFSDLRSEPWE